MLTKLSLKTALFLCMLLMPVLLLLPRQADEAEASGLNGYAPNYDYGYYNPSGGNGYIYPPGNTSPVSGQCSYDVGLSGPNTAQPVPWIDQNKAYLLILWDYGPQNVFSQPWINGGTGGCSGNPFYSQPYAPVGSTVAPAGNPSYYPTAGADYGNYGNYYYPGNGYVNNHNSSGDVLGICSMVMPGSPYANQYCGGYGYTNNYNQPYQPYGNNYYYNGYNNGYNNSYYGGNGYNNAIPASGYYGQGDPLGICPLVTPGSKYAIEHCGG